MLIFVSTLLRCPSHRGYCSPVGNYCLDLKFAIMSKKITKEQNLGNTSPSKLVTPSAALN